MVGWVVLFRPNMTEVTLGPLQLLRRHGGTAGGDEDDISMDAVEAANAIAGVARASGEDVWPSSFAAAHFLSLVWQLDL